MLADYHLHTEFSDDSVYPLLDVVRDAARLGLDEICLTDHVDYGVKVDRDSGRPITRRLGNLMANVDYPRYVQAIEEARQACGGSITLKMGLEFGVQTHTIPQFAALFGRYAWDFILLSIHQVEDKEFWTQEFQAGRTQQAYNERYYRELLDVVKSYKNYSVLAHMDLIKRYDKAGEYPFEKIKPFVAEILRTVIADGKGIEVNTSSHRYGLADSMPSTDILKLYKDLGGRIVTIGSDSHTPAQLAADRTDLLRAQDQLRALGFAHFCTFEAMQPVFHRL